MAPASNSKLVYPLFFHGVLDPEKAYVAGYYLCEVFFHGQKLANKTQIFSQFSRLAIYPFYILGSNCWQVPI